jgi:predicted transcriptional regulator
MNSSNPSRRRGTLAITIAILKAARQGVLKTRLINSVAMSYEQSVKYLEFLKTNGFVENYGKLYKTTEKGLELIDEFESSPLTQSIVMT